MHNDDEPIDVDHLTELRKTWTELEPRIARLSHGPSGDEFYRRLRGEYRVATLYAETTSTAGLRRYAAQLQRQGLRTMTFDGVAGAAEFVVGAHVESRLLAAPELRDLAQRSAALIERALAAAGTT